MRIETAPVKREHSSKSDSKNLSRDSLGDYACWKNLETFEEINEKFEVFREKYFKTFSRLSKSNGRSIENEISKFQELTHLRRQIYAEIIKKLGNCSEAQNRLILSPKSSLGRYNQDGKWIKDIHIPEADTIKAKLDIFDSLCNYLESISGYVDRLRKERERLFGPGSQIQHKADYNELNIIRTRDIQIMS